MSSLEDQLFKALEEERRISEQRALLPGLLHHDLANVLTVVSTAVDAMGDAKSDLERARYHRFLRRGVDQMIDFLSGMRLLYLSRERPRDFQRGDLSAFLQNLADGVKPWDKGPIIECDLPESMWCVYSPTLVRHALLNLLGNAIQYCHGTWVRLRLSTIRGGAWQISVANGGPGIPADSLDYLFDLGRKKVPIGERGQLGHCGLGLYIARMCATALGSDLKVFSRNGLTVFSFPIQGEEQSVSLKQSSVAVA